MSQRSEEISTTISDSEGSPPPTTTTSTIKIAHLSPSLPLSVGKKTIKAKEHIEKFVMDPQPAQRAGPGPIIADDEMKAMGFFSFPFSFPFSFSLSLSHSPLLYLSLRPQSRKKKLCGANKCVI